MGKRKYSHCVTYEVALKLKERGFHEKTRTFYNTDKLFRRYKEADYNSGECVSAPDVQMAADWVMKEYGVSLCPVFEYDVDRGKYVYRYGINDKGSVTVSNDKYDGTLECVCSGIEYVMEHMDDTQVLENFSPEDDQIFYTCQWDHDGFIPWMYTWDPRCAHFHSPVREWVFRDRDIAQKMCDRLNKRLMEETEKIRKEQV